MGSDILLFLHVFFGMLLLGALLTAAVTSVAARTRRDERGGVLRKATHRAATLALLATITAIALGEGLAGQDRWDGTWLDVGRALSVFGLLVGGAALGVLARLSPERTRVAGLTGTIAGLLCLVALAVAFLMAAKPS